MTAGRITGPEVCGMMEFLHHCELPAEYISPTHTRSASDGKRKGPSWSSPLANRPSKQTFKMHCEVFIRRVVEKLQSTQPNWAEFFHTRMQEQQNLLEGAQVVKWMEAFHFYSAWCKGNEIELAKVARTMVDFCRTHFHDPDNVLMGLKVNTELFSECYERSANGKRFRLPASVQLTKKRLEPPNVPPSRWLLGKISETALSLSGGRKGGREVASNCDFLPGEIALWCPQTLWHPSSIIFVRVSPSLDLSEDITELRIHLDPHERESVLVPLNDILPLHPSLVSLLEDSSSLHRLITDPLDLFFQRIQNHVKTRTNTFLEENGIDCDVLRGVMACTEKQNITLKDMALVNRMYDKLSQWKDNPPAEFLGQVDEYCQNQLQEIEQHPPDGIFKATMDRAFEDLHQKKFSSLAYTRIKSFIGNCDTARDYLFLERNLYLNGTRKSDLTLWWLTKINKAVRRFLEERAYNEEAIPEDYTTNPPDDMVPIKKNLEIIQHVLHPADDDHTVLDFIDSLKEEIYEKINIFVTEGIILLSDELGIPEGEFDISLAEEKLEGKRGEWEPPFAKSVLDLVKDVDYLLQMQKMESIKAARGSGLVLSDVVPISGLIMSAFFRRENVLRTIIELFDYMFQTQQPVQTTQPEQPEQPEIPPRASTPDPIPGRVERVESGSAPASTTHSPRHSIHIEPIKSLSSAPSPQPSDSESPKEEISPRPLPVPEEVEVGEEEDVNKEEEETIVSTATEEGEDVIKIEDTEAPEIMVSSAIPKPEVMKRESSMSAPSSPAASPRESRNPLLPSPSDAAMARRTTRDAVRWNLCTQPSSPTRKSTIRLNGTMGFLNFMDE